MRKCKVSNELIVMEGEKRPIAITVLFATELLRYEWRELRFRELTEHYNVCVPIAVQHYCQLHEPRFVRKDGGETDFHSLQQGCTHTYC